MHRYSHYITLSAMFMALSILFPVVFHGLGVGSIFLPMFWPLAAAAFFLPISYAALIGVLSPVLSSLFTGMPPISPPILHLMIVELFILTAVTSLIYRKTSWGILWPLLVGLSLSRLALFFIIMLLAPLLGLPPALFSISMVTKGLPGVVIILIFIPLLVNRFKHEPLITSRK